MRWWWKILTATSPTEEQPNRRQSTWLKGSRNGHSSEASSSYRGSTDKCSTDKTCSKCSMIHAYGIAQRLAKNAINVVKNNFSSCCRSRVSQDKGRRRDRTQLMAEVQRDVTNPAEANAQGPDHGHDPAENQWLITLTASKSTDMT